MSREPVFTLRTPDLAAIDAFLARWATPDPDYDITGPLDAIDRTLDYERRRAGDARARRQTDEWRGRVARPQAERPDPTSILDEGDET